MIDHAQHQSIIDALTTWDPAVTAERVAEATKLREDFVNRFPQTVWATMPVEDYALGQGNNDTVSYWLEFKTKLVASMSGGSALKFLIFKRADGDVWQYPKEYSSIGEAWRAVRAGFEETIDLAARGQFDQTDDVKVLTGAQAARAKMLYLYFPDDLIPVTSKEAIDHFLLSLGHTPLPSVVRANRQLLAALRAIPELKELSTQELGFFVYHWNDPRALTKVVKIAPGELARYWDDCRDNSYICVGWDEIGDLAAFPSKEAFRDVFRQHWSYNGSEAAVSRKANELWTLRELQPGDTVLANRGTSELLAVGTVNDVGYQWRPERDEFRHTVGVDWDISAARKLDPPVKAWATTTVSKVSPALYRTLMGSATGTGTKAVGPERIYLRLEEALARRGQAVLYGPPGTGKTYTARRAAVWLLDGGSSNEVAAALLSDDAIFSAREKQLTASTAPQHDPTPSGHDVPRLTTITFHPSYAYEDFIEGYRPKQTADSAMALVLTDGLFKRVCDAARAHPDTRYVVLIDEINRGNIPKIFGELITLIEKDKRGFTVQLPQSGANFTVPPNVAIIGTMNTADRSVQLLDTALRRRFSFLELLPESDLLEGVTAGGLALDTFLDELNQRIRARFDREKQIGHAMFFHEGGIVDTPESFASMFHYELLPLLQEYLFEDYTELRNLLGDVIDAGNERIAADVADDPDALCAKLALTFGASASA